MSDVPDPKYLLPSHEMANIIQSAWDEKAPDVMCFGLAVAHRIENAMALQAEAAVREQPPEGCTSADARMLRAANHSLAGENHRLRTGLEFYAEGSHFAMHQPDAWDTVSGEPGNFWEDESNTATVEDGSVAKAALAGDSAVASEGGSCVNAELIQRITDYLAGGGLFNPELADHQAVSRLLIECRAALSTAGAQRRASEQDETTSAKEPQMTMTQAAIDVLAERQRQIEKEGWTPEHDDEHANGELARAAGAYALYAAAAMSSHPGVATSLHRSAAAAWPWDEASKANASTERRMLVKAGALVLAEIERLDRAKEQR